MSAPRDVGVSASVGACPSCGADLFSGDRFCGGCGTPVPQETETGLLLDLQQATLGEHEILGVLGRGGMGLVYLAHDVSLNRKVAVKVLPPSLLQGDAAVERFRREARIAASLRHRHITSVFGLKETTKVVFFVMEYVDGRTLSAILHDEGQLPINVVQAVLFDTGGALSYAHRREVVHRDLKPANVIIDAEGMAMITDFGVAKVSTSQGLTTAGSTVGSPKYMSPEQWSGKATSLSDQYALGCVAYELLAGRAPFEGETIEELMKQQLFDVPPAVTEFRPDTPPALADAVMRMLQKDPSQRWASIDAALDAMQLHPIGETDPARAKLVQYAKRGHDVRAIPKTPKSPIPISKITLKRQKPARQIPRWVWSAAAALVVLIVAVTFLALRPKPAGISTVVIDDAPATLGAGTRVSLVAHAQDGAGHSVAGAKVVWTSSDPSIVSVSGDGSASGVAAGTATLTAASGDKSSTVTISVPPPLSMVANVTVTPHTAKITTGQTLTLSATATDGGGRPAVGRVDWSTSAPDIAQVSANGVVNGVGPGTATVTAVTGGHSGSALVTVVRVSRQPETHAAAPKPKAAPAAPTSRAVLQMLVSPWAYVSIDGLPRGQRTRGVDTLPAGVAHHVRFERTGFATVDSTLTLRAGEQRLIRIQLTPRSP